ncbi:MAG TPA: AbgT family transporter [Bacteroidales bacterium]|nr:AbgT family transporter [Bacteroidales bacterium]HRT90143.1 AbgT family transporter [Bacteroidales bacterium]
MRLKFSVPHNLVIVFSIVIIAAVLTWIIPGGKYDRQTVTVNGVERSVIVNGSFHYVESQPQTWQIFSAFYKGFINMSHIIVFILMIGGAFWIMNETKSIDVGIFAFLGFTRSMERFRMVRWMGVNNIIITLVMVVFSLFGAIFGMSEETIAFAVIFVPLAISMGYDSLIGVALCYFAAHIGFAGAILNPFTVGIAQGLASVPLFTGIEYRTFCWTIITFVGIALVLWYAARIKKDPRRSPMYEADEFWRKKGSSHIGEIRYHTPLSAWITAILTGIVLVIFAVKYPVTHMSVGLSKIAIPALPVLAGLYFLTSFISLRKSLHFYVLNILAFTMLYLIVGVLGYEWYIMEIAALFLAMGLVTGIAAGKKPGELAKLFVEGVKDIVSASLVVGFAGGIIAILNDGQIIDTVLYSLSGALEGANQLSAVTIMYVFQSLLNLVITSGSAKAALTIPIMAEFSDIVGLTRQATIMAFQFGAGLTDMIAPTSGVLMGVLGMARIPYAKWLKWVMPILIILVIVGFLLLIPTVTMKLSGF